MYVYVWVLDTYCRVYHSKENAIKDFSEWAKTDLIYAEILKEIELQELIEDFKNTNKSIYIEMNHTNYTLLEKIFYTD